MAINKLDFISAIITVFLCEGAIFIYYGLSIRLFILFSFRFLFKKRVLICLEIIILII